MTDKLEDARGCLDQWTECVESATATEWLLASIAESLLVIAEETVKENQRAMDWTRDAVAKMGEKKEPALSFTEVLPKEASDAQG
jgi:hypothetical protein